MTQDEIKQLQDENYRAMYLKVRDELAELQQHTWVGLTDEEIFEIHKQVDSMQYLTFGKAIEAKLKQKNGFAEEKKT